MGLEIMEQDYSKIVAKDLLAIDNISIRNKLIVKILEPDLNIIM